MKPILGVIGGSGVYQIDELVNVHEISVKTPFGKPSDKFIIGNLNEKEIVFLPRHGKNHSISPSEINYRANIYAMKKLGVKRLISVAACGSLKEDIKPMDFVVVDQFVDRTNYARNMSFFDKGIVCHIEFSHPVCKDLSDLVYERGKSLGLSIHDKGTYVNTEGPAFSTLAEANLYRSWGMDVIGMTNVAEAKLSREAGICYSTLACVTDYDCWHKSHDSVNINMILENLKKNIENFKRILKEIVFCISEKRSCLCDESLKYAIITNPKSISQKTKRKLKIIMEGGKE